MSPTRPLPAVTVAIVVVRLVDDHVVAGADASRRTAAPPGEDGAAAVALRAEVGDGHGLERPEPDHLAAVVEDHRPRLRDGPLRSQQDVAVRRTAGGRVDGDARRLQVGAGVEALGRGRRRGARRGARRGRRPWAVVPHQRGGDNRRDERGHEHCAAGHGRTLTRVRDACGECGTCLQRRGTGRGNSSLPFRGPWPHCYEDDGGDRWQGGRAQLPPGLR